MENYISQNSKGILIVTSDMETARNIATSNQGEFYIVRKEIADCARTLTDLGISCRYSPRV